MRTGKIVVGVGAASVMLAAMVMIPCAADCLWLRRKRAPSSV
jgi:hypothetical protein